MAGRKREAQTPTGNGGAIENVKPRARKLVSPPLGGSRIFARGRRSDEYHRAGLHKGIGFGEVVEKFYIFTPNCAF